MGLSHAKKKSKSYSNFSRLTQLCNSHQLHRKKKFEALTDKGQTSFTRLRTSAQPLRTGAPHNNIFDVIVFWHRMVTHEAKKAETNADSGQRESQLCKSLRKVQLLRKSKHEAIATLRGPWTSLRKNPRNAKISPCLSPTTGLHRPHCHTQAAAERLQLQAALLGRLQSQPCFPTPVSGLSSSLFWASRHRS